MIFPHVADDDGSLRDLPIDVALDDLKIALLRGRFFALAHVQPQCPRDRRAIRRHGSRVVGEETRGRRHGYDDADWPNDTVHGCCLPAWIGLVQLVGPITKNKSPRMAWQYHGFSVESRLLSSLSVGLPRHPWGNLYLHS